MKYHSKILALACIMLFSEKNLAVPMEMNELHKIFYHQGCKAPHTKNVSAFHTLELGKVVLYFAKKPVVNALAAPQVHGDFMEQEFLFPLADVKTSDVQKMVNTINNIGHQEGEKPLYTIKLELVKFPIKGIKMKLAWHAQKVRYAMDSFQAITMHQGLVVRFFNQSLLDEIKQKGTDVLRTASGSHKGIVIDCGHGGSDRGTCGFFDIKEKDVTLDIGLHVAHLLRKQGFQVLLTRSGDVDVPLDSRTTFANKHLADIFVSIHANNGASEARGIETFCLTPQLFKKYELANHTHEAAVGIKKLYEQSQILAHNVHNSVLGIAKKKQHVIDRHVKNSVAQVLLGANMPSTLIELGFLSNKDEAALLKDTEYRQLLAQGIVQGIVSYFDNKVV